MKAFVRRTPLAAAFFSSFCLVALTAGPAHAGCLDGLYRAVITGKSASPEKTLLPARFSPAVYLPDTGRKASFLPVDWNDNDDSIVGLWQFKLDGGADFGTQAWHSDGTELMFSAGRNPATGDICQGVWRKVGPRTYTLNHIAMGWDFGAFGVRVHIHAVVKLDRSGNTYSGGYKAGVYSVTPADPFEEDDSNKMADVTGSLSGTRVNPD
jgi:hypothetical protein